MQWNKQSKKQAIKKNIYARPLANVNIVSDKFCHILPPPGKEWMFHKQFANSSIRKVTSRSYDDRPVAMTRQMRRWHSFVWWTSCQPSYQNNIGIVLGLRIPEANRFTDDSLRKVRLLGRVLLSCIRWYTTSGPLITLTAVSLWVNGSPWICILIRHVAVARSTFQWSIGRTVSCHLWAGFS